MPVMMVAGLNNFITSLDKLIASQQVFIDMKDIYTLRFIKLIYKQ
jgi:hypothetical protein